MKIKRRNHLAGKLMRVILIDNQRNATMVFLKELTTVSSFKELNIIVPTNVDSLKQRVIKRLSQEKELIKAFKELQVDDAETRVVPLSEYAKDVHSYSLDGEMIVACVEAPNSGYDVQLITLDYASAEKEIEKLRHQGKPSQKAKVTYKTLDEPMEGDEHEAV